MKPKLDEAMAYSMSARALSEQNDLRIYATSQYLQFRILMSEVLKDIRKVLLLLSRLATHEKYTFWAAGIIEIVPSFMHLAIMLNILKMENGANEIGGIASDLIHAGYQYYKSIGMKKEAKGLALLLPNIKASVSPSKFKEAVDETKGMIQDLNDNELMQNVDDELNEIYAEIGACIKQGVPDEINPENEEEMVWFLANQQGLLRGKSAETNKALIQMGLDDRNPERILRSCQSRLVKQGRVLEIGVKVGLRTVGEKIIHCKEFGYCEKGISLDDTSKVFISRYCSECQSCQPHPKGWCWTLNWQINQEKEIN